MRATPGSGRGKLVWRLLYGLVSWAPSWIPGAVRVRVLFASRYCTEIAPTARLHAWVRLGPGLVVAHHAGIGIRTQFFGPGEIRIGPHVTMGPECLFLTGDHQLPPPELPMRAGSPTVGNIEICEDVYLGARVIVLPGVTVGTGAVVGAGAVVSRSVAPYDIVAGNPATIVGRRGHGGVH